MKVATQTYNRLAKLVGAILTLMGTGLVAVFATYLATGQSPLNDPALTLDGPGLLIFASIGAFALPLGVSLFFPDSKTSARLQVAAGALGLMAMLRLAAFADADLRAIVGVTPLVEFFVFGGLGLVAYLVRPENESPIEIGMDVEVDAPASRAWHVLGEQFGTIGNWATGLASSSLDGDVRVGAVRTCELNGFGPFPAGRITEELLEYDPDGRKFTYAPTSGMPPMFESAKNRWSIEALDGARSRVRSHATIELRWWALPLAKLLGWSIRCEVLKFGNELRHRVEECG